MWCNAISLTIGADLDLTENDSVLSGGMKRQNLSLGLELDAFYFAQLRVGMMKNIADSISSEAKKVIYTTGAGLWFCFNLDVVVILGEGDLLGVFVQAGFKFWFLSCLYLRLFFCKKKFRNVWFLR